MIIAEGSTDVLILRESLVKLYPHLTDYFTFFDHNGLSIDGGAEFLLKFVRAFAAARISSRIVAIFDNDAAGCDACLKASRLPLPKNISVMTLPNIGVANRYPTIGPQGNDEMNINGAAVSIELFLGRHNLVDCRGTLTPVIWSNYVPGIKRYQGAIEEKAAVMKRFLSDLSGCGEHEKCRSQYPELVLLWETIFARVKS